MAPALSPSVLRVVDASGKVVAEGRNRVYERVGPPGQLANSLLAHAEVNALVALDPEQRYEDHVLYTALEPCLLCVGATVMATIGRIWYAGADPYGGGNGGLVGVNPHVERVPLQFEGRRRRQMGPWSSAPADIVASGVSQMDRDGVVGRRAGAASCGRPQRPGQERTRAPEPPCGPGRPVATWSSATAR